MAKYRKKSVVIEAIKFLDTAESLSALSEFIGDTIKVDYSNPDKVTFKIDTLEGPHIASVGDYIIKGIAGEFYSCKPDIFHATYEKVDEKEYSIDEGKLIEYIAQKLENDKRHIPNGDIKEIVEIVLNYELEYLKEKGIAE